MAEVLRPEIRVKPPGPNAKRIIQKDESFSSPSYIKEYPLVVERGEGPWVYDVDGNRYLDFMAGIAVAATGHSHPKVVKAIQESSEKFLHICGTDFYYETFSNLCEKLNEYVPKMGKKRVFLTNSGTEAVEGAIKLARFHTRRNYLLAFTGAFHGRTTGAIALTGSKHKYRSFFGPLMPGVIHVPYSNPYDCAYLRPKKECETDCNCVDKFQKQTLQRFADPKEIAAVFVEPVQGEGGYIFPAKKFLADLRKFCTDNGILLIYDEIQSGVGRTGQMFAADYFDVEPDVLLSAKGLGSGMPIGAIIAKESVMSWTRGTHGSTYGGNPVCAAAAIATLEVVDELLPHIRTVGEVMLGKLREMQKRNPVIADVRGAGMMIGVEFRSVATKVPIPEFTAKLEQLAFSQGLLLLGCGESTIRIAPPLVLTAEQALIGLEIFEKCIQQLGNPS
jgi:4-aminobutyrate aminotransferase